jgi:aminoglycoside 6-adenylyltransferase
MRTPDQVFNFLLDFANRYENIRAVVMNGSRTSSSAPKDLFRDFDIVYYCTDPCPFFVDERWMANFGELIILQRNEYDDHGINGVIYLMLFSDGVRIDLAFNGVANLAYLSEDTQTQVLLDKDGTIPPLPPSSDEGYFPAKPTGREFSEAVNEIFWCSNNLAKGIWRDELPYVKYMQDVIIRDMLLNLLEWYAAMLHGWKVTPGKAGKWLKRYLPADIWESVVKTYPGVDYNEIWEAQFEICRLARLTGTALAQELGFEYPMQDDVRVIEYLQRVRALPKNATSYD